MNEHFKLPLLTDSIVDDIIWGMENQDVDYLFNIKDLVLYDANTDDYVPDENLINLPPWTSSDGYQIMVSFANSCNNQKLKEKLLKEFSKKTGGVFRRFKDVLCSEEGSLKSWFEYKEKKMRSYVRSWYKTKLTRDKDELSNEDDLVLGGLLSDFEIIQLEKLDDYCNNLLNNISGENLILSKFLEGFKEKKAYKVIKANNECGALIYENISDESCILYYYIEEEYRGLGLFSLMFNLYNRELERKKIKKVTMLFNNQNNFIKKALNELSIDLSIQLEALNYNVSDCNSSLESAELAYLL